VAATMSLGYCQHVFFSDPPEPNDTTISINVSSATRSLMPIPTEESCGNRAARRLTRQAQIDALEDQNSKLRQALAEVSQSIRRGSTLIARIWHEVPEAKELIDTYLAAQGIKVK
jgi:hypothetical protein